MGSSEESTLVYGYKPVMESVESDPEGVLRLVVSDRRKRGRGELKRLAKDASLTLEVMSEAALNELCGHGNHQGLAAFVAPLRHLELDEALARLEGEGARLVLVLDQVQDPQNLGAILRSAGALGVDCVIIPERRACPVNATVMRASAGVARKLPIARVRNIRDALDALKNIGFWVSGAVAREGRAPWEIGLVGKVALVLGSEGAGIRPRVVDGCDHLLTIPLEPGVESLNVSAAAAMFLFEIRRQRSLAALKKAADPRDFSTREDHA